MDVHRGPEQRSIAACALSSGTKTRQGMSGGIGGQGMSDTDPSDADPFGAIGDEFVEAFRQGRCPSVEEFARRDPEHADAISIAVGVSRPCHPNRP